MTLAHRAVGDIRRGGFRQLRNYVDMCSSLAKRPQQKDFFAYAQKALQRTDSCYYSLVHNLLDTVDEDRLCTVGVNMGFGGLIYGASEMKKQADVDGKPFSWITAAHCGDPALPDRVGQRDQVVLVGMNGQRRRVPNQFPPARGGDPAGFRSFAG